MFYLNASSTLGCFPQSFPSSPGSYPVFPLSHVVPLFTVCFSVPGAVLKATSCSWFDFLFFGPFPGLPFLLGMLLCSPGRSRGSPLLSVCYKQLSAAFGHVAALRPIARCHVIIFLHFCQHLPPLLGLHMRACIFLFGIPPRTAVDPV